MTEPKPTYMTINSEPLSTKQLHELIVSQSMTIDAALTRQGELVDALKRIREYIKNGMPLSAIVVIDEVLK